jgi:hypothetical protein
MRNRRRDDCFAVEPYYGRSPVRVTTNSLVFFADLCVFARNESSVKQRFAQRRKDPQRRKESLSIDQPSRDLFENSFRFSLDLFLRLILDRVRDVDRIKV